MFSAPHRLVPALVLAACLACAAWAQASAVSGREAAGRVVLATLEWPPYAGEGLPGQGASVAVVRAALAAVGLELEVRFLPWKRAVQEARHNPDVAGCFPEYATGPVRREFLLSGPVGESPLGLIHPAGSGLEWTREEDLAGLRLGTVLGYQNTPRFDELAASGLLKVEVVVDDAANLRKTAHGRLGAAVMDANVFRFLLARPEHAALRGRVELHGRLIGRMPLHVCFPFGPEGEALAARFNEGLSRIHAQEINERYLRLILGNGAD
jgi:polar amino acid transport system substrate-binding protein